MDETAAQPVTTPSPALRQIAMAAIALVLIALVSVALEIQARGRERAALGKGLDSLGATLVVPLLEARSVVNTNRAARLQPLVEGIAEAGGYESVTLTDADGAVLATTDTRLKGQVVEPLKSAPEKAAVGDADGAIQADRAIVGPGGERLGAVRVRLRL
jgi:hypothetical protein